MLSSQCSVSLPILALYCYRNVFILLGEVKLPTMVQDMRDNVVNRIEFVLEFYDMLIPLTTVANV